jgi:hypothetical protein
MRVGDGEWRGNRASLGGQRPGGLVGGRSTKKAAASGEAAAAETVRFRTEPVGGAAPAYGGRT